MANVQVGTVVYSIPVTEVHCQQKLMSDVDVGYLRYFNLIEQINFW